MRAQFGYDRTHHGYEAQNLRWRRPLRTYAPTRAGAAVWAAGAAFLPQRTGTSCQCRQGCRAARDRTTRVVGAGGARHRGAATVRPRLADIPGLCRDRGVGAENVRCRRRAARCAGPTVRSHRVRRRVWVRRSRDGARAQRRRLAGDWGCGLPGVGRPPGGAGVGTGSCHQSHALHAPRVAATAAERRRVRARPAAGADDGPDGEFR